MNSMVSEHDTELSIAYEQLRQSILQIEEIAAVQERNRIARDIHDSLGYALTALNIQLQTALKLWRLDPAQAERFLAEAYRLGAIATQEVRQSVGTLRSDALVEQCPEALIDSLVKDFHSSTGVLPSTSIVLLSTPLPIKVVKTIYRIVQEALTNICKYGNATEVQIQLCATPNNLCLIVQDNGKGFKLSQNKTGFGIQGMQERVAALKGTFNIETEPGFGCRISVNLPLQPLIVKEQKKPEEDSQLTIEQKTQAQSCPSSVLSLEQYNCLKMTLLELVGPIAPLLLQEVVARSPNGKELVENLAFHLTKKQRIKFENKAKFLFGESVAKPKSQLDNLCGNDSFISQCERDLADLIGPIASLLVQKVVKHSPQISHSELVKILAAAIPDPQKADKFQQRLLS